MRVCTVCWSAFLLINKPVCFTRDGLSCLLGVLPPSLVPPHLGPCEGTSIPALVVRAGTALGAGMQQLLGEACKREGGADTCGRGGKMGGRGRSERDGELPGPEDFLLGGQWERDSLRTCKEWGCAARSVICEDTGAGVGGRAEGGPLASTRRWGGPFGYIERWRGRAE